MDDEQSPFSLDENGNIAAPTLLTTDYIEMAVLVFLLLFGLPLNGFVLHKLVKCWTSGKVVNRSKQEGARSTFLWLKIQLTLVDLILILCYCPSKLIWLISYQWYYGEALCKIVQYSWLFSSHLMSYAIVSIAIDRVRTVYRLMHIEKNGKVYTNGASQLIFVKRLILVSYVASAIFSLPQFLAWTTFNGENFSQCTTVWHYERALSFEKNNGALEIESYPLERAFILFHLLTVFWIPFCLLFFAYFYIVVYLFWYSLRPYSVTNLSPKIVKLSNSEYDSTEQCHLWNNASSHSATPLPVSNGVIRPELPGTVPAWRIEMRSKMFHTSVQVIAAYLICWMPYNILALATFFNADIQIAISTHAEVLRIFYILNTVVNPFIYGFRPHWLCS